MSKTIGQEIADRIPHGTWQGDWSHEWSKAAETMIGEARAKAADLEQRWLAEAAKRSELEHRLSHIRWIIDGDHPPSTSLNSDDVERIRQVATP